MIKMNKTRASNGFALLGLVIALAIIALLMVIYLKPFTKNEGIDVSDPIGKANNTAALADIKVIGNALELYKMDKGDYPSTAQGLRVLKGVGNPKDPWGRLYVYTCPGAHNKDSFDIISFGKDGVEGGTGENADVTNY